jgi:hypothetical protein
MYESHEGYMIRRMREESEKEIEREKENNPYVLIMKQLDRMEKKLDQCLKSS